MSNQLCFLFPGQGSQSVGMGFSFLTRFPDFEGIWNETLREADAALGFSLSNIMKEGPAEKLKETEITQPALLTVSTAMGRYLKSKNFSAAYALGHSLGEYSALVHAEALSFQSALKLVALRGRHMQHAVPSGVGGMTALIGATPESAAQICKKISEDTGCVLEISALNSPGQVVVSGHTTAIDQVVARAKEFGIRMAAKLEVSGPFHCSLLKKAGEDLRKALDEIEISAPRIPVISNVTAKAEKTPEEIRENLEKQVSRAVLWENSIRFAAHQAPLNFIEVGSGKVLTGLLKKILPDAKCVALDTIENLSAL